MSQRPWTPMSSHWIRPPRLMIPGEDEPFIGSGPDYDPDGCPRAARVGSSAEKIDCPPFRMPCNSIEALVDVARRPGQGRAPEKPTGTHSKRHIVKYQKLTAQRWGDRLFGATAASVTAEAVSARIMQDRMIGAAAGR